MGTKILRIGVLCYFSIHVTLHDAILLVKGICFYTSSFATNHNHFYPLCAVFYWAVIEGVEANWRMAVIFQGLFAFLFSLSTISIEYALKAWLPTKIKRIASIVWNTLTIFLIIIFLAVFIVEAYQIK